LPLSEDFNGASRNCGAPSHSNQGDNTMPAETLEEAHRAQKQIEDFARLAHNVKVAVEALGNASCNLADWPETIDEPLPQLRYAADVVADQTREWAMEGDCDFDPSAPRG
jgi:hypothetical protein